MKSVNGAPVITTVDVEFTLGHPPEGETVLRTVYVPGVLADKSMVPVAVFENTKPALNEVNTPATALTFMLAAGSNSLLQYGDVGYVKPVIGVVVIETVTGSISSQAPTLLRMKKIPDVATLDGLANDVVAAALVQ